MFTAREISKHGFIGVLVIGLSFSLPSCGGGGGGGGNAPQLASLPSVTALYPNNGSKWNDYVKGKTIAVATDTLCSAATDTACIHAGEVRVVTVTGKTSCTGLTASDSLGAFSWTCDAGTGTARMISSGLKDGKYLSDLLDFTTPAWKSNSVTVYSGGQAYGQTPSTVWWTNAVSVNNTGGPMTAGTIHVITTNPTKTYVINVNSAALVVKPGVLVTGSTTTGETLISANGKNFIWLEGSLNAAGDTLGVYWSGIQFSMLRNVSVINADTGLYKMGIWISSSNYNRIRHVKTANTMDSGFILQSSSYNDIRSVQCVKDGWLSQINLSSSHNNYLENIMVIHSRQMGLDIYASNNNTFVNLVANNNHSQGVVINNGSASNILMNVVLANNGSDGIQLNTSPDTPDNLLINVSAVNNQNMGVSFYGGVNTLMMNTLSVNSNYGYFVTTPSGSNRFVNTVAANQALGIDLDNASNNVFSGQLKMGNVSTNCFVTGGTNPGLVTTTCANNGSSNATLQTGITTSASFMGKIYSTDVLNPSNTNGTAQFQNISDWLNFNNFYRMWGRDGSAPFPHVSNTGYCGQGGATEDCRIYDWSLVSGDTGDSGGPALLGILSRPTGSSTITHAWSNASTVTFMMNAVEILGDGIGNDNGLCESGETCLYTPNIGAYQGHGNLISAGLFTDGTITGVTLMKYETNGR